MILNTEFTTDPVAFFKKYGVDARTGSHSMFAIKNKNERLGKALIDKDDLDVGHWGKKNKSSGVQWYDWGHRNIAEFDLKKLRAGEVVLEQSTGETDSLPMYYLPWGAMSVMSLTIPYSPKADYFFTAALSGCSVFVRGSDKSPTIYHCGSDKGGVDDKTADYREWVRMVSERTEGFKGNLEEINKYDYLSNQQIVNTFGTWIKQGWGSTRPLKLEQVSPMGCVFGYKNSIGRWNFYLQQRISVEVTVFKKYIKNHPNQHILPGGGSSVGNEKKEYVKIQHKLFGKTIFTKTKQVGVTQSFRRVYPTTLKQIFPSGGKQIDLVSLIKAEVL